MIIVFFYDKILKIVQLFFKVQDETDIFFVLCSFYSTVSIAVFKFQLLGHPHGSQSARDAIKSVHFGVTGEEEWSGRGLGERSEKRSLARRLHCL